MRHIRIGIDTGGTFTDVAAPDESTGVLVTGPQPRLRPAGRRRAHAPEVDRV